MINVKFWSFCSFESDNFHRELITSKVVQAVRCGNFLLTKNLLIIELKNLVLICRSSSWVHLMFVLNKVQTNPSFFVMLTSTFIFSIKVQISVAPSCYND